jgi:hypothetical protein
MTPTTMPQGATIPLRQVIQTAEVTARLSFDDYGLEGIQERQKFFQTTLGSAIQLFDWVIACVRAWRNSPCCQPKTEESLKGAFVVWVSLADFLLEKVEEVRQDRNVFLAKPRSILALRDRRDRAKKILAKWKTFSELINDMTEGQKPEMSLELLDLAKEVIQEAQSEESDTEEWASHLADDLVKAQD